MAYEYHCYFFDIKEEMDGLHGAASRQEICGKLLYVSVRMVDEVFDDVHSYFAHNNKEIILILERYSTRQDPA